MHSPIMTNSSTPIWTIKTMHKRILECKNSRTKTHHNYYRNSTKSKTYDLQGADFIFMDIVFFPE